MDAVRNRVELGSILARVQAARQRVVAGIADGGQTHGLEKKDSRLRELAGT